MPPDPATRPAGNLVSWGNVVLPLFEQGARYSKVAAGRGHNLALKSDGTIVAWGQNGLGQCLMPMGLGGVVAIAAGSAHSLAAKNDGTVVAWGDNSNGQTNVPAGLTAVVSVAAGGYHSLALKSDGTVVVWGESSAQTGVPAGLSGVAAITAGQFHSLALKTDGTVVAWGANNHGEIMVPAGLNGVVAISSREYHNLALKNDGTVVAWGSDAYGQCSVPPSLSGVVGIAAGGYHSLALKNDGTVVAWGYNSFGQITVPTGLNSVVSISGGDDYNLALHADGTVAAWGANSYAQSTAPVSLSQIVATSAGGGFPGQNVLALKSDGTVVALGSNKVPFGLSSVRAVSAGGFLFGGSHSLALKSDGTVVAWGDNTQGQTNVPANLNAVVAVAAGGFHSIALRNDGTVVAWGYNAQGQTNVPVSAQSGVMSIAAGLFHNLALKSDGTVVAWGDTNGQNTVPANLSGVMAIAAGNNQSLALKSDGTVVAWGTVWNGSTNVGVTGPADLSGVMAIAAGFTHSLAMKTDGAVITWGYDINGQSTVPPGLNVPTGLGLVLGIAAGFHQSLAIVTGSRMPPSFTLNPQNQTVAKGANVTLSASASGTSPVIFQWLFNNVPIPGATSATLTLNNVQPGNAGRYSLRAVNAVSSAVSSPATLAVQADPASGSPPAPIPTPAAPAKAIGRDSLILITHGWQPSLIFPIITDVPWVDEMAAAIQQSVPGNWQVVPYKWLGGAQGPSPGIAFLLGTITGNELGDALGRQSPPWSHIHLIGHSAGAGLIQAAADLIKLRSPSTTVHTTFLDPHIPLFYLDRAHFGQSADWSDTYFARDSSGPLTSDVPGSRNVDVTALAPSGPSSGLLHLWPYKFYGMTVTNGLAGALGYGFPLSLEGGNWANKGTFQFPRVLDGVLPLNVAPNVRENAENSKLTVSGAGAVPVLASPTGTVQVNNNLIQLLSGYTLPLPLPQQRLSPANLRLAAGSLVTASLPVLEPAWVSLGVTVTNLVNYVKFEAGFTSAAGAQGVCSVYWGTNLVGLLDERVGSSGLPTYRFPLPETYTNGVFTLGFRLDAYTTTQSSLTLTNIVTGFFGITNPPALTVTGGATNGPALITLTGPTNFYSLLQSSTDLTNWSPVATLVNSNGVVQFSDMGATNQVRRFYRAVVP